MAGPARTPLAFLPTQRPSCHPMPRSMASPNSSTGIASYASSPASCHPKSHHVGSLAEQTWFSCWHGEPTCMCPHCTDRPDTNRQTGQGRQLPTSGSCAMSCLYFCASHSRLVTLSAPALPACCPPPGSAAPASRSEGRARLLSPYVTCQQTRHEALWGPFAVHASAGSTCPELPLICPCPGKHAHKWQQGVLESTDGKMSMSRMAQHVQGLQASNCEWDGS